MAACVSKSQAAGKHMNLPRHSKSTVVQTATPQVAVLMTFMVLAMVAGTEHAFATIDNTATAAGDYNGDPVTSNTAAVAVDVAPALPSLEVTKVATPNSNVAAGTLVTYTYTVRNAGNQTLTNVSLNDVHSGSGPAPVPGNETLLTDTGTANDSTDGAANDGVWSTLAPGDVITLTSTYTITQSDVDTQQ
jgi:large repetitive protein